MTKKLKISFEDAGTQVDAWYFDDEVLSSLRDMVESEDADEQELAEFVQGKSKRSISVSKGMYVHSDSLKCCLEDGDHRVDVSIMPVDSDEEDMTHQDWVEESELEDAKAILVADTATAKFLQKEDGPSPKDHVMLDIAEYDHGQLVGYFDVDDDFSVENVDMEDFSLQLLNVDGEGEIRDITYGEGTIGTEYEDEIYKLKYKGQDIELNLNFQGGGGQVQFFIRDEDGDLVQVEPDELSE